MRHYVSDKPKTGRPHRKGEGEYTITSSKSDLAKWREIEQSIGPLANVVHTPTPAELESFFCEAAAKGERTIFTVPAELMRYFHYPAS